MAPDRDAPGERLFLQLQTHLPNLSHHSLPPNCKDYSDFFLQNLQSVPAASSDAKSNTSNPLTPLTPSNP